MQLIKNNNKALISVYNKTGIIKLAAYLNKKGVTIISTEGTSSFLEKSGIPHIKISNYIDFPEIMQGRIKTLHPKIYGGILADHEKDIEVMNKFNINFINIVIVNLYPFSYITKKQNHSEDLAIKYIDIGGLSLIRAAAKNYKNVTVITDYKDYNKIIKTIDQNNTLTIDYKLKLAAKAFKYVTTYDETISTYFNNKLKNNIKNKHKINYFPDSIKFITTQFIKKNNIRYGENNHQNAAFYMDKKHSHISSVSTAQQLQGKTLSYNNIVDIDTALQCVKAFKQPTCVIVKHNSPCGVASDMTICSAYQKAYQSDPISAFGGIIAFNKSLDTQTSIHIIENKFIEAIIAPSVDKNSLNILAQKKNIRILICGNKFTDKYKFHIKTIDGGLLIQDQDIITNAKNFNVVTQRSPSNQEINDAIFCWKIVKFVKSNAIVYAYNQQTIGIGAGQMSRVFAVKIANLKVKEIGFNAKGASMASDAFFPFPDGIEIAAQIGITCIIQPGGSIKDKEIIATANKYNISMIFTNIRHFKH